MSWLQIMGYISSVALLLPVALILLLKLYKNRCLTFLMIYYTSTLLYALMTEKIIDIPAAYVKGFGILSNLLDVPLALFYLLYFTKSPTFKKRIHAGIIVFSIFEIATILFVGYNTNTVTIIMGPGILLIAALSFSFFIEQIKNVVQFGKAPGKALMTASTLFMYGCFFIIYLFWYIIKTEDVKNAFLVYFYVVTLSSLLMSIGLVAENKRFKMLEELNTTRKELSMLYPDEKVSFPKKAGLVREDDTF